MQSPPHQSQPHAQPQPQIIAHSQQYLGTRAKQEDYVRIYALAHDFVLGIMADGMGGHDQGEKASAEAAEHFLSTFCRCQDMATAMQEANQHLAQLKQSGNLAKDAGCTLIAVSIHKGRLSWCSVGDSYIILVRQGRAFRINKLHTWGDILDAKVEKGIISQREAQCFTNRKALYSALTGAALKEDGVEVINDKTPLQTGDRLLLCSDGIDTLGTMDTICQFVSNPAFLKLSAEQASYEIIRQVQARNARSQDNTTALVMDYGQISQPTIIYPDSAPTPAPKATSKKVPLLAALICLGLAGAALYYYTQMRTPNEKQSGGAPMPPPASPPSTTGAEASPPTPLGNLAPLQARPKDAPDFATIDSSELKANFTKLFTDEEKEQFSQIVLRRDDAPKLSPTFIATLIRHTQSFKNIESSYIEQICKPQHKEKPINTQLDFEPAYNALKNAYQNENPSQTADTNYVYSLIEHLRIQQSNSSKQAQELHDLWQKSSYPIAGYAYIAAMKAEQDESNANQFNQIISAINAKSGFTKVNNASFCVSPLASLCARLLISYASENEAELKAAQTIEDIKLSDEKKAYIKKLAHATSTLNTLISAYQNEKARPLTNSFIIMKSHPRFHSP